MSNKKYLIFFDMDDTLLDDSKNISPLTKKLLHDLEKDGHIIVLASGRPLRDLILWHKEIKLHSPLISYTGLYLTDKDAKDINSPKDFINKDPLIDIYKELEKKGMAENVYMDSGKQTYILNRKGKNVEFFFKSRKVKPITIEIDDLKENLLSFYIVTTSNIDVNKVYKIAKPYKNIGVRFWYNNRFIELYNVNYSKSRRVKELIDYYQIPKEHVIAFGDSDNDIDMLKEAGISVAMKNGQEHVKKIADIVTEFDNNNEGVYYELLKLIK